MVWSLRNLYLMLPVYSKAGRFTQHTQHMADSSPGRLQRRMKHLDKVTHLTCSNLIPKPKCPTYCLIGHVHAPRLLPSFPIHRNFKSILMGSSMDPMAAKGTEAGVSLPWFEPSLCLSLLPCMTGITARSSLSQTPITPSLSSLKTH